MPPHDPSALNKLYYGDNLAVLRDYIADASVDLIYLDPPFNSRQDYNVLFAEKDGSRLASQPAAGLRLTHRRTCSPASPLRSEDGNIRQH
jgi:16S rRNA G966 N2-methylase RsmD